jgi:hypothetical protein
MPGASKEEIASTGTGFARGTEVTEARSSGRNTGVNMANGIRAFASGATSTLECCYLSRTGV